MACCIKTVLEVKPQRNVSCGNTAQDEQVLLLGSTGSIHCPSLSCQSDVQSPEMTWYKVWMDLLKLV
jgi:interleukin 18 receptor accessory protein